jgi:hypothetical protein
LVDVRALASFVLLLIVQSVDCRADTPCPTVSSNIDSLPVAITGSATSGEGFYDQSTGGLIFQPTGPGNRALYFIGVPKALVIGHQYLPWTTLNAFPQAIVQDQSTCPILLATGRPLQSGGANFPTTSPMVRAPCSLITDDTEITLLSLMGPPYSVYMATYDPKTQFIDIRWADGGGALFVAVPKTAIAAGGVVQWASLANYEQALMLENSACPLVLQGSSG